MANTVRWKVDLNHLEGKDAKMCELKDTFINVSRFGVGISDLRLCLLISQHQFWELCK